MSCGEEWGYKLKVYLLNPSVKGGDIYIREGRCMQKASSWVTIWPPITLGVFGAIAKRYGTARLFDGNVENTALYELVDDVRRFEPDVLVVNTGFPSIDSDMDVAKKIKEQMPDVKMLSFGVYFTLLEDKGMRDYTFLDFAILGEPEDTFDELLDFLSKGRDDFCEIKGLMYRESDGVHVNDPRPFIEDLDRLPYPARDLFKNERYRLPHNNKVFTLINSARGCPFSCIYCIVKPYYGQRVRRHSIGYIIDEVKRCKDKYGIKEFLFWEEVFTLNNQYISDLCDAFEANNLDIKWAATTRVDAINEKSLMKMKQSGCYLIGLGIESGNQGVLDNAKKGQTIEDIRRAVALSKKVGIKTMGHFIFGLPGETRQTAQETIDFMLGLGLDFIQSYCAVPYPKTEFGELAKKNGWVSVTKWSRYDFGGDSIVNTDTMTAKDTTYYRDKAFRSFYLRPLFLIRKFFGDFSIFQLFRLSRFFEWMHISKS